MRALLLLFCLSVASAFVWTGNGYAQPAGSVAKGKVLEIENVPGYTYLHLKTKDGETWAAVPTAQVKKGDKVTINNASVMSNFESKTLKKTFPTILFGTLGSGAATKLAMDKPFSHPPAANIDNTPVAKASGANARTVAEIISQSASLKDKPVLVRGRVVKFNAGIMGKNWVHLRDGTGSAADKTNDILVTTANETNVGDIVTAKGIIRTDKDFGSGYTYKVLIEEATLQ
jgi:hypothetical protein